MDACVSMSQRVPTRFITSTFMPWTVTPLFVAW
jgi:hypothetical protein